MVAIGDPRDAICDAVDQLNPTFLIVGSHGYGAIKRYLFRSQTLLQLDIEILSMP